MCASRRSIASVSKGKVCASNSLQKPKYHTSPWLKVRNPHPNNKKLHMSIYTNLGVMLVLALVLIAFVGQLAVSHNFLKYPNI